MIEDTLFSDCEQIADKYEYKLIEVLLTFTRIESGYKRLLTYVPYKNLLEETELYFKNCYIKKNFKGGEVK